MIKTRKFKPVAPPMVLVAVSTPIMWLVAGSLMFKGSFVLAETMLVIYAGITFYTIAKVYVKFRSFKDGFTAGLLQILGHAAFVLGWWSYLLRRKNKES